MIDFELEGKVAIVTGASRGLGRAAATALIEQGVQVLAVARSLDDLQELESVSPDTVRARQCDMHDTADVSKLPSEAIDAFGRLDIVVNNAGIALPAGFSNRTRKPGTMCSPLTSLRPPHWRGRQVNISSTRDPERSSILPRRLAFSARQCWSHTRHPRGPSFSSPKHYRPSGPARGCRSTQLLPGHSQQTRSARYSSRPRYWSAVCERFL